MPFRASVSKKTFQFRFNARTSRGTMKEKDSWFLKIWNESQPETFGVGECGPLPGLSMDDLNNLEEVLGQVVAKMSHLKLSGVGSMAEIHRLIQNEFDFIQKYPAIIFALETAILDLSNGGNRTIFKNKFLDGQPIPINGLVWMGGLDYMLQEVEIKIRDGFNCIKLKIGGIDFEKECDILQYIRRKYFRQKITIRLDANGSFKPDEALYKIKELSKFDVHSIEQPIKPNSDFLPELCRTTAVPIALDEELIGVLNPDDKKKLLDRIKPHFIILKPSLHGGLHSCAEWIGLAEQHKVGWWLTSALESNIGLNAIAQLAAEYLPQIPQGLGTGLLYHNNFPAPLSVAGGELSFNTSQNWDISSLT